MYDCHPTIMSIFVLNDLIHCIKIIKKKVCLYSLDIYIYIYYTS